MSEYLKNNEREVIDMFGFEWNEQEERKALLETGEELGEARGEARGKIKTLCDLIVHGLVSFNDLKASGRYTPEELAAISKSI